MTKIWSQNSMLSNKANSDVTLKYMQGKHTVPCWLLFFIEPNELDNHNLNMKKITSQFREKIGIVPMNIPRLEVPKTQIFGEISPKREGNINGLFWLTNLFKQLLKIASCDKFETNL